MTSIPYEWKNGSRPSCTLCPTQATVNEHRTRRTRRTHCTPLMQSVRGRPPGGRDCGTGVDGGGDCRGPRLGCGHHRRRPRGPHRHAPSPVGPSCPFFGSHQMDRHTTDANATVTRISLFCKVAAPVAFSLVMAFTSRSTSPPFFFFFLLLLLLFLFFAL